MSCINKSFGVNKADNFVKMGGSKSKGGLVKTADLRVSCGSCSVLYAEYKQLLEHLYWRHGTEGFWCKICDLKRWRYAPHVCHVLPINDGDVEESSSDSLYHDERESEYCSCGRYVEDSPMIGCDGPSCSLQWYHFACVGIVAPPDGDWFCPDCVKNKARTTNTNKVYLLVNQYIYSIFYLNNI